MKLKRRVKKLEDVPEEFRKLYEKDEDEGDFVLASVEEDEIQKGKLKEFRDKNIELKKQLEALGEKFKRKLPHFLLSWTDVKEILTDERR